MWPGQLRSPIAVSGRKRPLMMFRRMQASVVWICRCRV
ncbi:hypothetical protein HaLaN_13103, partial [Haematococcus lacustris]